MYLFQPWSLNTYFYYDDNIIIIIIFSFEVSNIGKYLKNDFS